MLGLSLSRNPIVPRRATAELDRPTFAPSIVLTGDGWLVGELIDRDGRAVNGPLPSPTVTLRSGDGSRELDRDEILVLVPPATSARPAIFAARRRVPVTVDLAGLVRLTGTCHLVPGAGVWDVWQRSTSGFAALTDVIVEFPDGTSETADVVFVSRHAAASGLRTAAEMAADHGWYAFDA